MLKFGQKEVTTKDFYGQRQINDIFTIDVNKFVISDKVPCNNGKDCCYIVGYQVDRHWYHCLSRHLKMCLAMVLHNMIKILPIQYHSMSLKEKSGRLNIKRIGMKSSHSYLKNWQQDR